MTRLPLRLRVAVAAGIGLLVAVAALGAAARYIVGHELHAAQDRALRGRAADVARLSASAPALLTSPGALDAPNGGEDLLVEVLDRHGRIVARSAALGGRLLSETAVPTAIRDGRTSYGSAALSGEPLRLFAAPLPDTGGMAAGGAVLVASTTREIDRTVDRVQTLILLCAIAAAAIGGALAALLTQRGLAPVRRLADAAAAIEHTGDPSRRLPADGGGELGALTRTLNAMLSSLAQARSAERRLLADASHELRTPIMALRGNVDYVARHGADPEAMADLRADVDRLGRLVDDLLVLERPAPAIPERVPVALDRVAREAAAAATVPVTVTAHEPVWVTGEEAALRRAVENMVANAAVHGAPPVTVAVRREGDRARLSVSDGGSGLSAHQAAVAFDRFWRAPAARGRAGSGLGLAIVRATARAHGGDVEVAGATFTIDLPIGPSDGESSETRQRSRVASRTPR
ncbi:MAG TPA: HAMP domain-containing sensor histidine kinase [Baekduia sp.]|uniref:sensor histidine kinase n=1 Tax=Baekduia sp. TaxID=2600305 RepID=UPI002B8E2D6F|nr:HAMP domain-containing sensor histidine kinase [Baekduia sp.]HMJ36318.1 HAMP domain-containing sensor histidine kinase [Baekduia sp.]